MNNLLTLSQKQLSSIELLPASLRNCNALLASLRDSTAMSDMVSEIACHRHIYLLYAINDSDSRSASVKDKIGAIGLGGNYGLAAWRKWSRKLLTGNCNSRLDLLRVDAANANDIAQAVLLDRPFPIFSPFIVLPHEDDNDTLQDQLIERATEILRVRTEDIGRSKSECWETAISSFLEMQMDIAGVAMVRAKDQLREITYFILLWKDDFPTLSTSTSQGNNTHMPTDLIVVF